MNVRQEFFNTLADYSMKEFYRRYHYDTCGDDQTFLDCECFASQQARSYNNKWSSSMSKIMNYVEHLEKGLTNQPSIA